jgi:hypothetical protein
MDNNPFNFSIVHNDEEIKCKCHLCGTDTVRRVPITAEYGVWDFDRLDQYPVCSVCLHDNVPALNEALNLYYQGK